MAEVMQDLARLMARVSPVPISGCWLWTGSTNGIYGKLWLHGRLEGAHRASWILHRSEIPAGHVVCHECDVPLCVNPAHLFIGTTADNVADKIAKHRQGTPDRAGSRNGRARLTPDQVREIRATDGTLHAIGDRFGVSFGTVHAIRKGRNWRHLA